MSFENTYNRINAQLTEEFKKRNEFWKSRSMLLLISANEENISQEQLDAFNDMMHIHLDNLEKEIIQIIRLKRLLMIRRVDGPKYNRDE